MKNKKEKGINGDYTQLSTKILIRTAAALFGAFALISAALRLFSGSFSSIVVGFLEIFYKDYEKALSFLSANGIAYKCYKISEVKPPLSHCRM